MELTWKLVFVAMLLVVGYPNQSRAYAAEGGGAAYPCGFTSDDQPVAADVLDAALLAFETEETVVVFVVVIDGGLSCDDDRYLEDDGTRGVVIYDPDDLGVLNAVLVELTDSEPWFYDMIEAFCPASIRECSEPVYNGGAGDWGGGEVILYTVDDLVPLEEAVILLLEKFPFVLADESAWACGCE